jgi:hypothetical protein
MRNKMGTKVLVALLCIFCVTSAIGCGGSANEITVVVSPESALVEISGTIQFSATVIGSANKIVGWSASCGTITASGLYSAPDEPGACMVTATSQADNTKHASATVTITPPVLVTISPASITIGTGETQHFTATVTGPSDVSVIWSANCGTVSTSGLYTAPKTPGTCTVVAASHALPTKSAVAMVTVLPLGTVTISPKSVTMNTRQTQQFEAEVIGTTNQAVNWSASCGTISSNGLYTAPGAPGTCVVTATSQFDPRNSASAIVTLTAPPCSDDFAWLRYYATPNGTASGKAIAITYSGAIVAGVDSVPEEAVDTVATLVFYGTDGTEQNVWTNDSPSSITSMTYDAATDLVLAAGHVDDSASPGGHSGMLLVVSADPPQILVNEAFQLAGARTEVRAISIQGDRIYLAVNSDYQQCSLAQDNCSGDWIVVTDLQGNILSKFAVGNTAMDALGPTSITGMVLTQDSLFVTGDMLDIWPEIDHYFEEWSLDGQLKLTPVVQEKVGTMPLVDDLGNFYVVGTKYVPAGLYRRDQASISVGKIDLRQGFEVGHFYWDILNIGTHNHAKGAVPNSSGGLTVVGSLQQIGNYPLTDGGAVSLDPDLNVLWIRRFDNLPLGSVASWNAVAYDADGEALLVGTGSDGRTGCDQTPCPVSVIGRFCAPTTP